MNKFKIISFLILTSFSSFSFAGAAEQWNASPRQMTIADMGMRTRNGIGVGNVKAANGMINADITQRVTVDGSNATINTKVSIPANDAFYKNTAGYAKNILRGGLYGAAAAAAMGALLDGVDYVMDEGGKITRKPTPEEQAAHDEQNAKYTSIKQYTYNYYSEFHTSYSLKDICSWYVSKDGGSNLKVYTTSCTYRPKGFNNDNGIIPQISSNPNYNPNYVPSPIQTPSPSDPEMNDAFFNWFKNNPQSITDPVTTYIYSPKDSQGKALPKSPEGTDPSFGPNEITDEMMNNYMEHRNANLQNPYTTTIGDSTQMDTTQNPDGSKTSTKTNPDGSKTTTRTDTKTDPDSGEVTTTVTETTTNPDGSTSTKTETSTQTKPKPETTDLPAFCDYAATLCTWINKDTQHKADEKSLWDKIKEFFDDTPEKDNDTEIEIEELPKPTEQVKLPNSNSQCPSLIYNFDLRTFKAQADFSPVWLCEIAQGLYFFFVGLGWYLSACILGWRSS